MTATAFKEPTYAKSTLGDDLIAIALARGERLALASNMRKEAADFVDGHVKLHPELKGLKEEAFFRDWKADTINYTEAFEAAASNPGSSYLSWLLRRLGDPFRPTAPVFEKIDRKFGSDLSWEFASYVWKQEIAWAQRLRRSEDDGVVLYAEGFVRSLFVDHNQEFEQIAALFAEMGGDLDYHEWPERTFSASQIRHYNGSLTVEPLFLRLERSRRQKQVEGIDETRRRLLAAKIREAAEAEFRVRQKVEIAAIAAEYKLSCALTVLQTAAELRMSSDQLVVAESAFLASIDELKPPLPLHVTFPVKEFSAWLRTRDIPAPGEALMKTIDRKWGLARLRLSNRFWIETLPTDFKEMRGADHATFGAWMSALGDGPEDKIPADLLVDYGLHLVRKSLNIDGRKGRS